MGSGLRSTTLRLRNTPSPLRTMAPVSYARPSRAEFRADKDAAIKIRRAMETFKAAKRMKRQLAVEGFLYTAQALAVEMGIPWIDVYAAKERSPDYNLKPQKALRKKIDKYVLDRVEEKWGVDSLTHPEKRDLADLPGPELDEFD